MMCAKKSTADIISIRLARDEQVFLLADGGELCLFRKTEFARKTGDGYVQDSVEDSTQVCTLPRM